MLYICCKMLNFDTRHDIFLCGNGYVETEGNVHKIF